MIRLSVYQRYSLLALSLIIVFLIISFIFSVILIHSVGNVGPPIFFAKIINADSEQGIIKKIRQLEALSNDMPVPHMILYGSDGNAIYPKSSAPINNWNSLVKPAKELEYQDLHAPGRSTLLSVLKNFPLPIPGVRKRQLLIKVGGDHLLYLAISPPKFSRRNRRSPVFWIPAVGIGSLIVSLLFGIGATTAIIYAQVRKATNTADDVIWRLQHGDLKARFSIKRKDEFGKAMQRFNSMADEIEKLVSNLRTKDRSRRLFFQELAHDLRTPIASLKTLLETLKDKRERLDAPTQNDLFQLAGHEVEYFEKLVEDLLLLAQVNDAAATREGKQFEISKILAETGQDLYLLSQQENPSMNYTSSLAQESALLYGDPHLIERLFRNALQNAFSFARHKVTASIQIRDALAAIVFEDDGPGFDSESLAAFGERRISREIKVRRAQGRISIGLGSVIMKRISEAYGGTISASNIENDGQILGARIEIILPLDQQKDTEA